MPRVFIPTSITGDRDLSSLVRYGTVTPLLRADLNPDRSPGPSVHEMYRVLAEQYRQGDYLAYPGGAPNSAILMGLAFGAHNPRDIALLKWDRERSTTGERTGGGFYTPLSFLIPWRHKTERVV